MSTEESYDKKVEDIVCNIGLTAHLFGCRPSDLFEWNEPDEWLERLLFDMDIAATAAPYINKMG